MSANPATGTFTRAICGSNRMDQRELSVDQRLPRAVTYPIFSSVRLLNFFTSSPPDNFNQ